MERELDTIVPEEALVSLELQEELLPAADAVMAEDLAVASPEILAELVIEEVSIDGMCGVY